jgi:mRNA interferase MazF
VVKTGQRRGAAPDRGDAVWLTIDSSTGHEQAGRRPAIVISNRVYNSRSGLATACPVTTSVKGYPFEVVIPEGLPLSGAVLADQPRTFDWRARKAQKICAVPAEVTDEVVDKLQALVGR